MMQQEESMPSILMELREMLVIHKPPGWQVHAHDAGLQLCVYMWVQKLLPDIAYSHGSMHFIHNLDSPCSGVLLVGQTFEANNLVCSQLLVDVLMRDYIVIVPEGYQAISAKSVPSFKSAPVCRWLLGKVNHRGQR